MRRILTTLALCAAAGTAVSSTVASSAAAEPTPPPEPIQLQAKKSKVVAGVIVLHASNGCDAIDPKIPAQARSKLEQPPFSAYKCYKLLEKTDVDFSADEEGKLALPNKGELTLGLKGIGKKFDVAIAVTKPDGSKFLSVNAKAREKELFFLAGPKHQKGILVLGLEFRAK